MSKLNVSLTINKELTNSRAIKAVESVSLGEFENWILNHSTDSSQVIAIRASLRVIPALNALFLEKDLSKDIESLLIGTFRACFVSDIYVKNQTAILYRAASDAVASSYVVSKTLPPTMREYEILLESPSVAGIAARAAHVAISSNKTFMARTIDAINASISSDQFFKDLKWADRNPKAVNRLLSKKLWFQKENSLFKEWEILKLNLLNLGYNWNFWIEWYQSKLDGTLHPGLTKDQQDELYYRITTLPNEIWEKGPEVVNQRIVELFEEREISKYDFYLSYSRDDEEIATKVKKVIEQEGFTLSPRVKEYSTNSPMVPEIHEALDVSSKFICLYSNSYWTNAFKLKEWTTANTYTYGIYNNFLIPFLIKDSTVPIYANEISYTNLLDLNEHEFTEAILKAIKKDEKLTEKGIEETETLDIEIPPQNKGALQFKTNEDGIIELDHEAIENELLNDQDAIDRHNEVDYLANELISSYDPNSSSANAARPIVTKVQRYLEALGDTPAETNINFIIPRGEVLRQELEREENRDEFTNSPPLPDNFKSALSSLVSAHNLYVLLDPVLDERDQARLGPDAKKNMISAEKGHQIVLDALNFGIIKDDTEALIAEDLDLATTNPGPESRVARRASENIKNFVKEILSDLTRKTKPFFRASGKIMGATTVTGLMLFREEYTRKKVCLILKHRDWFIKSFGVNPSMKRMMEEFIQYLEGQSILNDKDKSS